MTRRAATRRIGLLPLVVAASSLACGSECDAIARRYGGELSRARSCDPATEGPCAGRRPAAIDVGSCDVPVSPDAVPALDALIADYQRAGCPSPGRPPCPLAPAASCQPGVDGFACTAGPPP